MDIELKKLMNGQPVDTDEYTWEANDYRSTAPDFVTSTLVPDSLELGKYLQYYQHLLYVFGFKTDLDRSSQDLGYINFVQDMPQVVKHGATAARRLGQNSEFLEFLLKKNQVDRFAKAGELERLAIIIHAATS